MKKANTNEVIKTHFGFAGSYLSKGLAYAGKGDNILAIENFDNIDNDWIAHINGNEGASRQLRL